MDVDNNLSEVLSLDNYQPSEFLSKLCRKVSKANSETIYWYYEFGLAITVRLNELIGNGQKKVRETLNNEVLSYFFHFSPQTTLATVKDRMKKGRNMYDLFSVIGAFRIYRICIFFANEVSSFTKDEITFIKSKVTNPGTP